MTDDDLDGLADALLLAASRARNLAQGAEPCLQPALQDELVAPIDALLASVRELSL